MALGQRQADGGGFDHDPAVQLGGRNLAEWVQRQVRLRGVFARLDALLLDFIAQFVGRPADLAAAVDVGEGPDGDASAHVASGSNVTCSV
jgi:hypothetical protein